MRTERDRGIHDVCTNKHIGHKWNCGTGKYAGKFGAKSVKGVLKYMDGLIVKPKWGNKILYHGKRLEVRGSKTSKIGVKLYLLESGNPRIKGTFCIERCIPINRTNWEKLKPLHQVNIGYEELVKIYPTPFFWELRDVSPVDEVWFYVPHRGAVIWVKDVIAIGEMD